MYEYGTPDAAVGNMRGVVPPYEAARSWPMRQFHDIDGRTFEGDHPDPVIRHYVADRRQTVDERLAALDAYLTQTPNHNAAAATEIDIMTRQAYGDFGPAAAGMSVTLLEPPAFARAVELGGLAVPANTAATVAAGRLLLRLDPAVMANYGTGHVLGLGLHETAHASEPAEVVQATKHTGHGAYAYREIIQGGFVEAVDWSEGWFDMPLTGVFWEEAFADSYRVRRLASLGLACTAEGWVDNLYYGDGTRIGMTDGVSRTPRISQARDGTRIINLPWRYLYAGPLYAGNTVRAQLSEPALAAHALDLLDERRPGLFDTMLASRQEHDLKRRVREQVDRFSPGLYDHLSKINEGAGSFRRGLAAVMKLLGVGHEPVVA